MSLTSEFPNDVWEAAVSAVESVSEEYFEDHTAIVIARAIMAERARWKHPVKDLPSFRKRSPSTLPRRGKSVESAVQAVADVPAAHQ